MNLIHMKYAVEVAETGSINKTAEKLYVGQPNLSRAIKELEASLGVTIFERSAKGMFLTPDGEVFIRYAKNILKQVDAVEGLFKDGNVSKKRFSISVPRASYIADAFAKFTKLISSDVDVEISYKETNSTKTFKNILQEDYKLGIIRYEEIYDKYYKSMMDEKGLYYELVTEFNYALLINKNSPLASEHTITPEILKKYIEISHADPFINSLPFGDIKKAELPENSNQQIFIYERASQFELLSQNPETFMWVSPVPDTLLERYDLIQRHCNDKNQIYKDVLVHKKEYVLSDLDKLFISELCKAKREIF